MLMRDLLLYDQAMYNSLHGRFLETSGKFPEGGSLFAERFYLIMILVLPIYAIFPTTYTLFFLQALAGGAGAIVVFLLAKHYLRREMAATCFALAYLLHPSLGGANLNLFYYGFHPDAFFPPLVLYSLYSLQKGKPYLSAFFWVLALAVDECKYSILLAAFGLYLLIVERRIKFGATMTTISILWFFIGTQVIVPHFLGGKTSWFFLSQDQLLGLLNLGLGNLALTLFKYVLFLIAPLLLLPLADLPSLSVIMPILLVYLAALSWPYDYPMVPNSWHVNAVLPIIFLSAILGMRNLLNLIKEPLKRSRAIIVGPLLVLLVTAFSIYWFGPLPFSRGIHPLRYAVDENIAQSVQEVRALISHEASLAASRYIGSNFTQQRILLPLARLPRDAFEGVVDPAMWKRADYILVDINPHFKGNRLWQDKASEQLLYFLQRSEDYEALYSKNDIWLFKKIAPTF